MFDLYSWGANSHGQLGLGYKSEMCTTPQKLSLDVSLDLENIEKMHGGGGHLLILDKNGRMFGCGWNSKGQLGMCNTIDSLTIKPLMKTDVPIVDISCGWDSSAAIDQQNNLYVWGSNAFDQLGFSANFIGTFFTFPMLLNLPLNEKAKKVCFGLRYMCILCESQNVYIVGRWRFLDTCEVIMHNDTNFYKIIIPPNHTIKDISSGSNHIVCVCIDSSASVWLIGYGDNKFLQCTEKKILNDDIRCLRSGWAHNGVLTTSGRVYMYGRNTYGQLASLQCDNANELIQLKGIDGKIEQFYLGAEHGLVVTEHKNAFTWGWNEHGNCGNGNETNLHEPHKVQLPGKCMHSLAAGGYCFALVQVTEQN
ncbi:secretion-regulating guanine nucleotide exchange factor [Contarinia nasturtii]|uniref:secretion-regulating guanine nucleotide exchange factor n=1 Tax=Contarinia nasturtii TaxID=265458 RepID=UPI0012D3D76E|nr:secretion-regulating guanine nucleotide exchange factor [Contarinia nasturtii]XP_031618968.1 secretion-regulating guanine nucleotide exchange factor [Contarinia nasturtii]